MAASRGRRPLYSRWRVKNHNHVASIGTFCRKKGSLVCGQDKNNAYNALSAMASLSKPSKALRTLAVGISQYPTTTQSSVTHPCQQLHQHRGLMTVLLFALYIHKIQSCSIHAATTPTLLECYSNQLWRPRCKDLNFKRPSCSSRNLWREFSVDAPDNGLTNPLVTASKPIIRLI